MKFTTWGQKLGQGAGIVDLMEDLGQALNVNPELLFLGGGNPACIPAFESLIARHMERIGKDTCALRQLVGVYQSPRGSESFIGAFVDYVNRRYQWGIGEQNVALTNGSQAAFFVLLNLFAGATDGKSGGKKVLFPMMPDYLGYADQTMAKGLTRSYRPTIRHTGEHRFKYHIDFATLQLNEDDGVVCVSRPANPTGNVLSAEEMDRLSLLAHKVDVPFIIDCAYGEPFPGIVYGQSPVAFDPRNIYVLSLSKLGLPGARTGIVVGPPEIVSRVINANTVMSLASGNLGPALARSLIVSGELDSLCQQILLPYYRKRRDFMLHCIDKYLAGMNYYVHEAEGAFFVWLWLPELRIDSRELYQRMKSRGVLLMDGSHFFFGIDQDWPHIRQCLRMTYCQSEEVVEKAIVLLAQELRDLK